MESWRSRLKNDIQFVGLCISGSVTYCHAVFTKHIKLQIYESWHIADSESDEEQSESGSGDEDNAEEDGSSSNDESVTIVSHSKARKL